MTVLDITGITRKETGIYYRREFSGRALFDLPGKQAQGSIEFVIETSPFGTKDIHVTLTDTVDYPLLPVLNSLKRYIVSLDESDRLP